MSKKKPHKKDDGTKKNSELTTWIRRGIVAVFALTPLVYFPSFAGAHITSKSYFFMGMVSIMASLWIWLLSIDTRYRLTRKNALVLVPLALFLLSLTISSITGIDRITSFFSTIESGTGVIFLWYVFVFTLIVSSFIRVHQYIFLRKVLQANLFASVILAIATFFADPRLFTSTSPVLSGSAGGAMMGNSSLAGAYFVFSIFLSLILICIEQSKKLKVWYWIGVGIILICPIYLNADLWKGAISLSELHNPTIFIGQARLALISVVVGLALSFFLISGLEAKRRISRTIGYSGFLGILVAISVAIALMSTPTTALHRFFVNWGQSSVTNRFLDWHEASLGIQEKPWLGFGAENYHVLVQKYLNPAIFSPEHNGEVWALHSHNSFLEILVNGGVIGFVFYVSILVTLIVCLVGLYRKKIINSKTVAFMIGMLFAYVLQDQLIYDSGVSYIMFFAVIAMVSGLSDPSSLEYKKPRTLSSGASFFLISATVLIAVLCVYSTILPSLKVRELNRVGAESSNKRVDDYYHLFHSAGSYAIDTDIGFYSLTLSSSYNSQREYIKSNPLYVDVATKEVDSLITEIDSSWTTDQYDYRAALSIVQLEDLLLYVNEVPSPERIRMADEYATKAIALSPTDPQIYVAYAETNTFKGDIKEARDLYQKALALNPRYLDAQLAFINFQKYFGTPQSLKRAKDYMKQYFPDDVSTE